MSPFLLIITEILGNVNIIIRAESGRPNNRMPVQKKGYLPNTGSTFYYSIFDFENDFLAALKFYSKIATLLYKLTNTLYFSATFKANCPFSLLLTSRGPFSAILTADQGPLR